MKFVAVAIFSVSLMMANGSAFATGGGAVAQSVSKLSQATSAVKAAYQKVFLGATLLGMVCSLGGMGCSEGDVADPVEMTQEAADTLKIGMIYHGPDLNESLYGAELAVNQINDSGGINGMMIELLPRDNDGASLNSVSLTESLIHEHGVHAIIGPEYSTHAVLMGEIAQTNGVPMVTTSATNPAVTGAGDYVFMATFTDAAQGRAIAQLAVDDLGAHTASILTYKGDVYSEGLSDIFADHFTGHGHGHMFDEVVARAYYDDGDTDFSSQIAAIRDADMIFIPGFVPEVALVVKQAREMGVDAQFVGADGWDSPFLVEVGGEAINGSYFTTFFSASAPADSLSANARSFLVAYEAEYGQLPGGYAAAAYDALYIVALAAEVSGDVSGAALRDAIASTSGYDGATIISGYDQNRHADKPIVVNTIEDGRVIFNKFINP